MLEISALDTENLILHSSDDDRVVVSVLEQGGVYVVFLAKHDRTVHALHIKADEKWLYEFRCVEGLAVHEAIDTKTFYEMALFFWPADQSLLRMKAISEFR